MMTTEALDYKQIAVDYLRDWIGNTAFYRESPESKTVQNQLRVQV